MTTRRCARRRSPAATTAMSTPLRRGLDDQRGAQRLGPHSGHGELDRRHRVLGEPEDSSMLPPVLVIRAAIAAVDSAVRLHADSTGDEALPRAARPVVRQAGR